MRGARSADSDQSGLSRVHNDLIMKGPNDMDAVWRLGAIEEIKSLKARYLRAVDERDWALFASVFALDAVLDNRGSATDPRTGVNLVPSAHTERPVYGRDAIVDDVRRAVIRLDLVTAHHGHMPEIHIFNDREAQGIWAIVAVNRFPPGAATAKMDIYGHYHQTYVCSDDVWQIKTSRLIPRLIDVS